MISFVEGFTVQAAWAVVTGFLRQVLGRQIKIVSPYSLEPLRDPQQQNGTPYYDVRGKLKILPQDHEIWLLIQDESSGRIWPQGFYPVQYDPVSRQWIGRINVYNTCRTRIIAVVAPPTSCQFFRYFQKMGDKFHPLYEPLDSVPPECVNRHEVQVNVLA